MNTLQEKRALLALAQRFGQPPAPGLVEEIQRLEEEERCGKLREEQIRQRIAEDLQQIWGENHELVQSSSSPPQPAQAQTAVAEPDPQPSPESTAQQVARVITEAGVVAPEPVLARPGRNLEAEVRRLEQWVSRIAATGPGSGEVNFRWLDDVDRSSINKDWFLNYEPSTKKFTFVDTRCSIEAFDRTSSIALTATPELLRPSSVINNKNITYDSSTGVFTFLRQCEVTLALSINALATTAGQRVYQYAERNTGSGWQVIANSGKSFQLTNGQHTQIVNAQTISRQAGEQIRYFIYSDADKVSLITETLPNTSGVYIPAIRIQYAGR